jgi:hypothetical protein
MFMVDAAAQNSYYLIKIQNKVQIDKQRGFKLIIYNFQRLKSKLMFKKVINENISSIDVHENETIHAVELDDDENDLFVSDLNQAAYDEEQIESEDVILDVDSVIDEMNDLAVADSFEEEAVDKEFLKKQMIDKLKALSKLGGERYVVNRFY